MTIFVIEMLKLGFLGFRQFKPSFAHSKNDLFEYSLAVDQIFELLSKKDLKDLISTPIAHSGFTRLTSE